MKAVFLRAIEASVDEKADVLRSAVRHDASEGTRFPVDLEEFGQVPRTPFAYWASKQVLDAFRRHPRFHRDGRAAASTNPLNNDPRFVRAWWEVGAEPVADGGWKQWAKGGSFAPIYYDIDTVIHWDAPRDTYTGFLGGTSAWRRGRRLRSPGGVEAEVRRTEPPASAHYFFRPGLTWPRRTNGLSFRIMPAGCIFADKGPGAFVDGDDSQALLALCALVNSEAFAVLVQVQLARTELAQSYEVGLIQQTPVPDLSPAEEAQLAALARRVWSLKRALDSRTETSHALVLPALLQVPGDTLLARALAWTELSALRQQEIAAILQEVNEHCFAHYGIGPDDRRNLGTDGGATENEEHSTDDVDDDDDVTDELDAGPMVASLLSWSVGVALGRFDVRLATGERALPPEPDPFARLPACSAGMLTSDEGLLVPTPPSGYSLHFPSDGIFVDDPGHPRDLVHAVRSVFETAFDDANARWHEASELLAAPDLRIWFATDFFELHVKRYSKSRRKAPIYWQLATASGSYSLWLYIHRATGDTLFRVLNDFVGPKLDHERTKLDGITQDAGANPSAAQRREIQQQETFVGELQALKSEIARVAPLWKPNLDDGVILNFAPLWRLVPQSRSWQGECQRAWDKLVAGDYDWAHIAMHLWPERVVPKCIDDRSLAIAHGLEDVFWHEDESGTWRKSRVGDGTVQALIQERTSTTVKAALKDLLSAATPTASKGRKAKSRSASPRTSAPKPAPAAARATPDTALDEATLRAVKAAIASVADGASKADVLAATGLSDGDWNKAIAALLDRGDVTRTGQKRGTRYHASRGHLE